MPRPRVPTERAKTEGRHLHNPQRYKDRADPNTVPLGEPSEHLTAGAVIAYEAFRNELSWLMESDRALVEGASILRGKMIDNGDLGISAIQTLSTILSKLGATPADRSRISLPDDNGDDEDEFDA